MTNKITFAHLRRVDMWGHHSPFGGVTLAMQEAGNDVKVGIAVCHEHDRYVKAEGRKRAEGRLHSVSEQNAKYRATLTNVTVQEVYSALDGDHVTPYLEAELPGILRGAGAQL